MQSLYFLIPIALILVAVAVKAFFWAVDNHQFDDLENEGSRILFDDDEALPRNPPDTRPTDADKP